MTPETIKQFPLTKISKPLRSIMRAVIITTLLALAFARVPQKPEEINEDADFTVIPMKMEPQEVEDESFTVIPRNDDNDAYASFEEFREYLASDRIVGGAIENPKNSNPWQVLVYYGGFICGGTLISARHVLTAAHCIPSNTAAESSIIAGASTWCTMAPNGALSWFVEPTQQRRVVKSVFRMGGSLAFGTKGQLFDIAILEVNAPYTLNNNVVVAKLPTARTPVGTNLIVSGWGSTVEGGRISCALRLVDVPVVNKAECNLFYGNNIRSSQICAGFKAGGKDSCQGDSGGPLVVKRNSCDATVVGVVSYGTGCARPNFYGVYTDVYTFLPWIRTVLSGGTWTSCPDSRTQWIGDNYCDNQMNSAACLFDAGDCCGNTTPGWNLYCGSTCICRQP